VRPRETSARELVSVLVPAYNHGAYVRDCLAALAAQTYRPLELLVADDASVDGTATEIARFLDERGGAFDRTVFLRNERNVGAAETLNGLLAQARGRYVFLNASDDRAAPHAIARLVDALASDPRAALAVGDSIIIDGSGRRVFWGAHREIVRDERGAAYFTWVDYLRAVNRPGVFERRLFGRLGTLHRVNYVPNGKLYRTAAVRAVGGWRPGTLEDWDLNFRLARRYRLHYVDEVLFAYRWHDSNTVRDPERAPALQQGTERAIGRQMRNPAVWLRVLATRDARARLRAWTRARRR
jgi:glycosyltransferase involved in cell wall biosynthesis